MQVTLPMPPSPSAPVECGTLLLPQLPSHTSQKQPEPQQLRDGRTLLRASCPAQPCHHIPFAKLLGRVSLGAGLLHPLHPVPSPVPCTGCCSPHGMAPTQPPLPAEHPGMDGGLKRMPAPTHSPCPTESGSSPPLLPEKPLAPAPAVHLLSNNHPQGFQEGFDPPPQARAPHRGIGEAPTRLSLPSGARQGD